MKKFIALSVFFAANHLIAGEVVDVRIQIPMANDDARIKDYYLSTDGLNLKKDLVVKVVRQVAISQGKKNIGEIKMEVGQLRILAVADKVAVAREYKLNSKDNAPLTENIGFMLGDQVDMSESFIDKSNRKPSSDLVEEGHQAAAPAAETEQVPASPTTDDQPLAPAGESKKIEVQVFPEQI